MEPLIIKSLCGSGNIPLAQQCLSSLIRASARPIQLLIHDDGTLSKASREALSFGAPATRFFSREEADDLSMERLASYPHCASFRRRHPLALKLFDLFWSCDDDKVLYIDTDVLFLDRFFFEWDNVNPETGAVFMKDHQSAYSLRSFDHVLIGLRMLSRVNTGFFFFRKQIMDLDLLEWFLGHPKSARGLFPFWLEQTCWALLAGRCLSRFWNPMEFIIPEKGLDIRGNPIAAHFVSPLRKLLPSTSAPFHTAVPRPLFPGTVIPRLGMIEPARDAIMRYLSRSSPSKTS